jgi:outer membrane protein
MHRALLAAILLTSGTALAEPRRFTVDDVVRIALSSHPRFAAARSNVEAAEEAELSTRGRLLPSVHLSEDAQHYDSPFALPFGGQSFTAREQNTSTFVASASQPVLGLLKLVEAYRADRSSAEAAQAGLKAAELRAREALQIEYLRLFEAKAMEQIAHASEHELGEEVTMTEAKVKAGSATNADLLRVQVARENARHRAIVANTEAVTARAALLSAIGADPEDPTIDFAEPTSLLRASEKKPSAAEARSLALERRPEIAEGLLLSEAASHRSKAARWAMLPDVNVDAAYMRVDGQVFAPPNSAYVGISAKWPIWEWGATYHAALAAKARAHAAESDLENERREIVQEVTARRAQLDASSSAVTLAERIIVSAEEAYRVTQALVRAGAATTTDLLQAEATLTEARLNHTRDLYAQAMAKVSLDRVTGTP